MVWDSFCDEIEKVIGTFIVYVLYKVWLNNLKKYRYVFLSNTNSISYVCVRKLFSVDDTDDDASMSVEARVVIILAAQLWLKVIGIWLK
jgi:hypothetical protein